VAREVNQWRNYRISVKRRRCAVGVKGRGVVEGAGQLPRKKTFFPQNDKFGRIIPQFLTGRKHGSHGTRILQFNREITKLIHKQCQNHPNIHDETKVAVALSPPEYAIEVIAAQRSW